MKLPDLFSKPPTFGRAKAPQPGEPVRSGVYATVECKLDRRELVGVLGPWFDWRIVTIVVYGDIKEDVVNGAGAVLSVFNRNLGREGYPTLVYPSGSRFMSWQETGEVRLEEDKDTARGKDVWKATIEGRVWSVRQL